MFVALQKVSLANNASAAIVKVAPLVVEALVRIVSLGAATRLMVTVAQSVTPLSVIEYWNEPLVEPPANWKLTVPSTLLMIVPPVTAPKVTLLVFG